MHAVVGRFKVEPDLFVNYPDQPWVPFLPDCYIRSPRTFCDTALACANMAVPDCANIWFLANLSYHTQAIEAGRSAIADVDFAAEATALARNQILAQSGTAMLAQASAVSQNVLGLLM
jgi:hypothetical protein